MVLSMTGFEAPALKLGGTIASHAVKSWLQRRRKKTERESSLAELAAAEVKGPMERRRLENLVKNIGLQVAEELQPVLEERFSTLPGNEIEAALLAVEDTLGRVDLSDAALLADNADPEHLAERVRTQFPGHARAAALSERAGDLYELALDQACRSIVLVVRHLPAFQSAALAEVLKRLGQQSDRLEELLAAVPRTRLGAPAEADDDQVFRDRYLSLLAGSLDKLDLLGLPMEDQPTLPLTVAYLSLSVAAEDTQRDRDLPVRWFEKRPGQREGATSMRAEEAVGGSMRTLVRGEAGSGKTTLLDWLAVTAARGGFTGQLSSWNKLVPFKIRLRSFSTGELPSPDEFVAHALPNLLGRAPEGWADRVLRTGAAMVLVDGVDEVETPRRRKVREWLRGLTVLYPQVRFVVTSRTAAAERNWLSYEGFRSVLMEPMTAGDIHALVARWHEAARVVRPEDRIDATQRRLLNQLDNRPHLRKLAASPLLCAMLCALNLAHRSELPRDRMDLYRKALSMLLHMRDAEREIPVLLNEQQKQVLLGHLAWRLSSGNKVELPRGEVLEHLEYRLRSLPHVDHSAEEVLANLLERSGVLRAPVDGKVDFVHRTFQEFLAANEATEAGLLDTLVANAHRDTWRETVVMACGHAKHHQAKKLLTEILDRADEEPKYARGLRLLAAACLETVSNVDPDVIDRVEQVIREKLVPPRSVRETVSLASVGPRLLRYLPPTLDGLSDAAAEATVQAATLTAGDEALSRLRSYAQDSRWEVQRQLAKAWEYFDPERFAREVLADSPLDDGAFSISAARLLPFAGLLRNLTELGVSLDGVDAQGDLRAVAGVPAISSLGIDFDDDAVVDFRDLAEHQGLVTLAFSGARRYGEVRALRHLGNLRKLTVFRRTPWRGLDQFGELKQVTMLSIDSLQRVETLDPLARMDGLTMLSLWDCPERVLAATRPINTIRSLVLFNDESISTLSAACLAFPAVVDLVVLSDDGRDLSPLLELPLASLTLIRVGECDLRPLADHPTLRRLNVASSEPLDVSPLADRKIRLSVRDKNNVIGIDKLGPGVTLR